MGGRKQNREERKERNTVRSGRRQQRSEEKRASQNWKREQSC